MTIMTIVMGMMMMMIIMMSTDKILVSGLMPNVKPPTINTIMN